jgi:hypothetical protein
MMPNGTTEPRTDARKAVRVMQHLTDFTAWHLAVIDGGYVVWAPATPLLSAVMAQLREIERGEVIEGTVIEGEQ